MTEMLQQILLAGSRRAVRFAALDTETYLQIMDKVAAGGADGATRRTQIEAIAMQVRAYTEPVEVKLKDGRPDIEATHAAIPESAWIQAGYLDLTTKTPVVKLFSKPKDFRRLAVAILEDAVSPAADPLDLAAAKPLTVSVER